MVDVLPDGRVLANGEHELTLDRAGRVYDRDLQPIALLEPDGRLMGPGDVPLGTVGALHAGRPHDTYAWLSVMPVGEVIRYDEDAERTTYGVWMGCGYSARTNQVCTLIVHLIAMGVGIHDPNGARPGSTAAPGVGVGIGIGIGAPIGR